MCILIFANLASWHSTIVGVILFLLYAANLAKSWRWIFAKIYGLEKKLIELRFISGLWVIALVALFSSVVVVFYRITDQVIVNVLFLVWLVTVFVESYLRPASHVVIEEYPSAVAQGKAEEEKLVIFDRPFWILPLGFFVLLAASVMFYFSVSTGSTAAFSPWQFIDTQFLFWFFLACFLIGLSIFARYRTRVVLVMIVLLTLLQHLYLPLSHKLPWGGDVWRVMAVENSLEQGKSISPVLFGEKTIEKGKIFGIEAPRVFLVPQKYTYGSLWGLSVVLSRGLSISLMTVNIWLMPILFSLVMPVLLFRLGFLLFQSRRRGLFLAWLALLPFPMQVWGGLTLPVSLGYLFFFLALWLWLEYWRQKTCFRPYSKMCALGFSLLMIFGYALHFILIWSIVILHALWKWFDNRGNRGVAIGSRVVLIAVSLLVIPVVELVSRYSQFSWQLDWWKNIKQLVGQFSGWFYAIMIRPHDIVNGNLFFNHTPERAFVDNFFLHWRWWLVPIMLAFWVMVFYGWWTSHNREKKLWPVVWILSAMTFGGYIISWYFLAGDHLFARRLDLLLPILTLILFISGLEGILITWRTKEMLLRWVIIAIIFVFSFFITATYASGPDVRVLDVQKEHNVAEYIWSSRAQADGSRCVLADTWILLPLETLSSGAIVGGGFPMDYNFGQTERVALFDKFSGHPEASDLLAMKKLTGANHCWFAQSASKLSQTIVDKITALTGVSPRQVNGALIWLINLKS